MMFDDLTPHVIANEMGERIKTARLNANLTQKELAKKSGVSLKAVVNSEKGKSTLESIIAILIGLEITEQLNFFIPKQEISPVQLIEMRGKKRQRATSSAEPNTLTNKKSKDTTQW